MTGWSAPVSFDDFVVRRYAALVHFAHALSGDPHTAADLVPEAFIRTGSAWNRSTRQEDPEAYLRRTIVHDSGLELRPQQPGRRSNR